ncbi:hypothetical protein [Micromonospora palythoicola]|uniref:hypothetical protein n=1 Tax=Micromonospora palythoicola TaxID=3120507 RepID=UPI002FCE439F
MGATLTYRQGSGARGADELVGVTTGVYAVQHGWVWSIRRRSCSRNSAAAARTSALAVALSQDVETDHQGPPARD